MLIISAIKTEIPSTRSLAIVRAIYLIPGAICALLLATSGVVVVTSDVTNTITAVNTTEVWTEEVSSSIELQNPIWGAVHIMIFVVIMIHVVTQMINLFTKTD
jgi:hypothetical protein